jgi:hypothetical protein
MNDGNFRMGSGGVPAKRSAAERSGVFRSGERSTCAPCFPEIPNYGQLLTRFVALTVPIPVAKSQPVVVP